MYSIGAFNPIVEKKFKKIRDWGGKLRAYKIKLVLFLYAHGFLAATKTLH